MASRRRILVLCSIASVFVASGGGCAGTWFAPRSTSAFTTLSEKRPLAELAAKPKTTGLPRKPAAQLVSEPAASELVGPLGELRHALAAPDLQLTDAQKSILLHQAQAVLAPSLSSTSPEVAPHEYLYPARAGLSVSDPAENISFSSEQGMTYTEPIGRFSARDRDLSPTLPGPQEAPASTPISRRSLPRMTLPKRPDMPVVQQAVAMTPVTESLPTAPVAAVAVNPNVPDEPRGQWRERLAESITALDRELARHASDDREGGRLAVYARLLHAVANDREKAIAEIGQLDDNEREFWKHQLHALLVALDTEDKHTASRRAALALRELREAVNYLSQASTLDVRNLVLCERVDSFGVYQPFKSVAFKPGQEVLLYVEIDNFTSEAVGERFETELHGEYALVGPDGYRSSVVLPICSESCTQRRRDYFIRYPITLPKDLRPGQYSLNLTIEDRKGQKSNQAAIDLRIR